MHVDRHTRRPHLAAGPAVPPRRGFFVLVPLLGHGDPAGSSSTHWAGRNTRNRCRVTGGRTYTTVATYAFQGLTKFDFGSDESLKASGEETMTPILPWLVLVGALLVPFIYRQRFRSASDRAALWLKPDGDDFIFHPFGKLGKAYRVSAAARDLIVARLATRTKVFYCVLLATIVPMLALASLDPADFAELRPYLSIARIAIVVVAIAGIWIWHRLAIRPLYAGAPESSVRISATEVRIKKASYTPWTTISLMTARLGLVACGLVWYGVSTHRPLLVWVAVFIIAILAVRMIRLSYFKLKAKAGA
jgi:hypothetical protein